MSEPEMRVCRVCQKAFPRDGKRKYCSPPCAREAQFKQNLKHREEAAGRVKAAKRPEPCDICSREFIKYHRRDRYCSDDCRSEGLRRAVEAQRARRVAARDGRV